ncbi:DUF2461 domain-containing protein [Robiginitalea sediminis]|uniref:DUF2461 domain-containing protein n=1 Tax=Robiginitalea sediminis TaxID=1982593 RepID=UPI000B4B7D56|nr:DUF2461 domain-containing protein [Robiginitalea sediminis]
MKSFTPEALDFLKLLKANNSREWFHPHKSEFKACQQQAKDFFKGIEEDLNTHDSIEKAKLFRIYRDIRFSNDKTPFNPHFACSFSRAGAERRGGYYLRVRPGESFAAIGFWQPNPRDLMRIRKALQYEGEEFREVIQDREFAAAWGHLKGDKVKTAPKGFTRDTDNIDLIRHKQFIFVREFTDSEVLHPEFPQRVGALFLAARPWFNLMSEILTTDLDGRSLLDQ